MEGKQKNNKSEKEANYRDWPHVLVVDDDDRIRDLLSRYLFDQGFVVLTAADSDKADILLQNAVFDALVVDVMMPGRTGLVFTKDLRANQNDVPVLLLTALGETEDRIAGLETGADDYLPKPFEPKELLLRLQAIIKRRPRREMLNKKIRIGEWVFDPVLNELQRGSETERLTSGETTLLKVMSRHLDKVLSREELARLCELDAGERTIDVQVTRLRRKIEEDSKTPRFLQTVRGKGYMLRGAYV